MRFCFSWFLWKWSALLFNTAHVALLLIWLHTVQVLCWFSLCESISNIFMMLLWNHYIRDLCFCFQRAVAYLFPSGLFDKRARPIMKVGFVFAMFLNSCSLILKIFFSFCWFIFVYLQHPTEIFPEQRSKCLWIFFLLFLLSFRFFYLCKIPYFHTFCPCVSNKC